MKKAYLLVFSDDVGSREAVKKCLEAMPEVLNWRYDMSNAFYIISEHSAQQLYDSFRNYITTNGRFLFTEVGENKQGWLTKQSWHLMRHKEYLKE